MRTQSFFGITWMLLAAPGIYGALVSDLASQPAPSLVAACPTADSAVFHGTQLAGRDGWYGKQLRALGERGFCATSDRAAERYRFTWIPTFHPAIVVKLERVAGQPRLIAKVLSGAGGYEPGVVRRDTSSVLSESEWAELTRLVRATDLWSAPQTEPSRGLDGAQWILEGMLDGRYNVVDRWSPARRGSSAALRAAGERLLRASGLVEMQLVTAY